MKKISCIIAAYNEGDRIGAVLDAIENHPLISEIIVVDDGSKDHTREEVKKRKGIKLLALPHNCGKSFAVTTGIRHSTHDHLLMLDADLLNLSSEDITRLIQPVLNDDADITISLRKNSLPIMRLMELDYISGERVFKKSFLEEHLATIAQLPGFAIESFMNRLIIDQKHRIQIVRWDKTITPRKSAKVGFWKGTWGDIKMIREILQLVPVHEIVSQNYKMHKLKVRKPRSHTR